MGKLTNWPTPMVPLNRHKRERAATVRVSDSIPTPEGLQPSGTYNPNVIPTIYREETESYLVAVLPGQSVGQADIEVWW